MFEKKVNDVDKKRVKKEAREGKVAKKKGGKSIGASVLSIVKVLVIAALFAGIVSVIIFMTMENKAEEAQLKTKVVVMKENVAQNTLIKSDEFDKYFVEMSVELTAVPESAYHSIKELPKDGLYIENAMGKS
ncbi:hypothetical protein [Hespellia stercorisuis]|uniref:Uncharacterized protein n=1 Tax=Hespellia stercorisuis DSM 15480 TaxID=1121950 RepID=A0A1M6LLA0_9FIRM|nr:hypothetical protein [Hespellia stercorisuis]SHJ71930.1 hypothetical protein SAMN02745243_01203 [Hespellia stercorisuis DSM 15480]